MSTSPELTAETVRQYVEQGRSFPWIAARHGVTPWRVRGLAASIGLDKPVKRAARPPGQPLTPEELRRLFDEGLSDAQLAAHFGVSDRKIACARAAHGLVRGNKPFKVYEEHADIEWLKQVRAQEKRLSTHVYAASSINDF